MVRQWSPTAACVVPSQAPVVCTLRVKGKANRPVGTAERDLVGWLAPGVVACQLLKRNQQDLGLIRPDFQRTQGQVQQHDKETATLACGIQHTHQQKVIEDSGRHLQKPEHNGGEIICGITLNFPEWTGELLLCRPTYLFLRSTLSF